MISHHVPPVIVMPRVDARRKQLPFAPWARPAVMRRAA